MPVNFKKALQFRPSQEKRLDDFDFAGGLVADKHETKLQPNESPSLQNVLSNQTGSIKTKPGYTRYNGTPVGATADQTNFGASAGTLAITAADTYVAQTFIPSATLDCIQGTLSLAMASGGQQQLVRVELWTTATSPSAIISSLAKSQILNVSGTSETTYNFRMSTPIGLTISTTYALVIKPYLRGTSTTVNQVNVHRTGNAYSDGQVYTSSDAGITWTGDSAKDIKFIIYKQAASAGGSGLLRFYTDSGVQQLIAKFGNTLYRGNDSTGAMTAITLGNGSTLDTSNFIDYTTVNGRTLLVVDGESYIQKYNGSTNANYSTGTITATNGSTTIAGSGTSWATSTNAEVGEYIQLPDGKWYKIVGVVSDTSLTIEIEYQGSTQSGQTYVISPWGEVQGKLNTSTAPSGLIRPTPQYIAYHASRVWTLEGNVLRASVLDTSVSEELFNDWDTSANAETFNIPSGDGDSGTGLYALGGILYIFQKHSIWAMIGTQPSNFELKNIKNELGMLDRRTLVEWGDVLIFLSTQGIVLFDGSNTESISAERVDTLIEDWANNTTPAAALWDNRYIISYTPNGGSYNSEVLVLNLIKKTWSKLTGLYAAEWVALNGGTDNGEIYFVSSNQGSIYKWDVGTTDDGYEIHTQYDTPSIGFDANVNDKTLKRVYIQQLAQGEYSMSVTLSTDLGASETVVSIPLSSGNTSLWDVAQWDVDTWSDLTSILTNRISEFQGTAKYFKLRFEETGYDTGIEILGATLTEKERRLT